uniref:Uncharacterized protein n=1 Tax=Glossina palpalis gambiensis TaxID=67801 RepID=A0A1B0AVZ1_9MUSC
MFPTLIDKDRIPLIVIRLRCRYLQKLYGVVLLTRLFSNSVVNIVKHRFMANMSVLQLVM